METVYNPSNWSATEPIDFTKYFKDFQAECNITEWSPEDIFEHRLNILKEEFKLPLKLDDIKELDALCTIDKLKIFKENPKLPLDHMPKKNKIKETHPIIQEAKALHTLNNKRDLTNFITDDTLVELRTLSVELDDKKDNVKSIKDVQPGSTFIHKVLIYIPFNTLLGNRLTCESVRTQYEIEVLGTNTLLDLVNMIECTSDAFITKEVPDLQVDFTNLTNAKKEYPSRCLFIENTFYNDMSHPDAIDYSEVVKKWAIEKKIGMFKSESMQGVTFDALKFRLGHGYVYIHQGNCEHVVCFADARLVQTHDCLDSKKYPRMLSLKRHSNNLCFICSEKHSSWMVQNSDRLPLRKVFFCTKCCESYMFLNGKKIGEFQLYPYYTGLIDSRLEQDENDWGYIEEN